MFSLIQYKEIFDKILTDKNIDRGIVANTYLHIINAPHPEFLHQYNLPVLVRFYINIRFKLSALIRIIQSSLNKGNFYFQHKNLNTRVLLISHLTSNEQLFKSNDIYFGNLTEGLSKRGVDSSTVLINHTKVNEKKSLLLLKSTKSRKFILSRTLGFSQEVKLYFLVKKSRKLLKKNIKNYAIAHNIKKEILMHCSAPNTLSALRIACQVSDIVMKTKAECVVTTCEGHAWERVVYYYIRKINPKVKCFGYQHSAIFEYQYALSRMLNKNYNPDVIFTSGKISQAILENKKLLNSVKIICLGSSKHLESNAVQLAKSQSCLVIPEGSISESLCLFELSLIYARNHYNQIFVWRLHPSLSFNFLKKYSKIFNNLPNNIVLSKNTLEDDIKSCDSALYRGSTAIVGAINSGLKPIYYQLNVENMSIDPIYQQIKGKYVVNSQKTLNDALQGVVCLSVRQELQDFSQNFYTPLNVDVFLRELRHDSNSNEKCQ